jgi:hypothetical protein
MTLTTLLLMQRPLAMARAGEPSIACLAWAIVLMLQPGAERCVVHVMCSWEAGHRSQQPASWWAWWAAPGFPPTPVGSAQS